MVLLLTPTPSSSSSHHRCLPSSVTGLRDPNAGDDINHGAEPCGTRWRLENAAAMRGTTYVVPPRTMVGMRGVVALPSSSTPAVHAGDDDNMIPTSDEHDVLRPNRLDLHKPRRDSSAHPSLLSPPGVEEEHHQLT
ncbi:hypothetical protein TRIUR3_32224 [Triticum urartu]|uniref:Uncharacterized protein n=1 Tax=Triticum urartu TaxID=4572 RepID=M7YFN0_TRIUA|nr:hypothetical protein TRIUR3_32224 [Triticum urartu]